MNRYIFCVVGALFGAACADQTKSTLPTSARTDERAVAPRTVAPTSKEVRAAGEDSAAGEKAAADNTEKNVRDRGETLTPMDQGNSSDETAITARIRRDMMAEPSLSFTAKNVKVVTTGSRVTLRGPVMSAAEKTLIAQVARRTPGVSDVDNQLEVKP
jgi:hyperosmotically inducible protein